MKKEWILGMKDGIPIALGYFCVSFGIGILLDSCGVTTAEGGIMSFTNVTSAGQFAGLKIIAAGGTLVEMILTQLIINLRYALMSLSLSQKLSGKVKLWQRFLIAFANTDEIFAVAMAHQKSLTFPYMFGLQSLPVLGWTAGTVVGAVAGNRMPAQLAAATGVALYGMFIAIVVPVARASKQVLAVAAIAILLSCLLYYVPALSVISPGISIILATVLAAAFGAMVFPVKEERITEKEEKEKKEQEDQED